MKGFTQNSGRSRLLCVIINLNKYFSNVKENGSASSNI